MPFTKVAAISLMLLALVALIAPTALADCKEMCQPCEKGDAECCQERNGASATCRCLPLPYQGPRQQDLEHGVGSRCQCKGVSNLWDECTAITYAKMMMVEAARVQAATAAAAAPVNASSAGNKTGH